MGMAKVLLVDGYNVINRVHALRPSLEAGLENARLRLALQVSTWHQVHKAFECVIVFDGGDEFAGGRDQRLAGIRCVFSRAAHGGDDEIIKLTRDYRGRGFEVMVVSDDNKVGNNCRAHGASVQPSEHIMKVLTRPRGKTGERSAKGKDIGQRAAAEIDRELREKLKL